MKLDRIDMDKYNGPFPSRLRALLNNENEISPLGHSVTQTELAASFPKDMPVTRQTISLWTIGKTVPDINKLQYIAEFFHVSCDYLLGKSDAVKRDNVDIVNKMGLSEEIVELLCELTKRANDEADKHRDRFKDVLTITNTIISPDNYYKITDSIFEYIRNVAMEEWRLENIKKNTFDRYDKRLEAAKDEHEKKKIELERERMIERVKKDIERNIKFAVWNITESLKDFILSLNLDKIIYFDIEKEKQKGLRIAEGKIED